MTNGAEEISVQVISSSELELRCEICLETRFTDFKNGNRCTHPFCILCVIKYIRVQLMCNNSPEIPCPALDCNNTLDPVGCADAIGSSLFLEWCDVLCRSSISGFDRSYCPDTNCGALIVDECSVRGKEAALIVDGCTVRDKEAALIAYECGVKYKEVARCPSCKKLFCFKCKNAWHGRGSCPEDLEREDVAFLRDLLKQKKLRRCPNCRFIIQLIDGCSRVKCRCGMSFCYACGKHECSCKQQRPIEMTLGMWLCQALTFIVLCGIVYGLPVWALWVVINDPVFFLFNHTN